MVRISGFHPDGPGSIPGVGSFGALSSAEDVDAIHNTNICLCLCLTGQKDVRRPGIEPGSIAWKATMLTFTPPTLRAGLVN